MYRFPTSTLHRTTYNVVVNILYILKCSDIGCNIYLLAPIYCYASWHNPMNNNDRTHTYTLCTQHEMVNTNNNTELKQKSKLRRQNCTG